MAPHGEPPHEGDGLYIDRPQSIDFNRRDFLKTAGAAGSVAAHHADAVAPGLPLPPRTAAPAEPLARTL